MQNASVQEAIATTAQRTFAKAIAEDIERVDKLIAEIHEKSWRDIKQQVANAVLQNDDLAPKREVLQPTCASLVEELRRFAKQSCESILLDFVLDE